MLSGGVAPLANSSTGHRESRGTSGSAWHLVHRVYAFAAYVVFRGTRDMNALSLVIFIIHRIAQHVGTLHSFEQILREALNSCSGARMSTGSGRTSRCGTFKLTKQ
jgi:hypothetical protein